MFKPEEAQSIYSQLLKLEELQVIEYVDFLEREKV